MNPLGNKRNVLAAALLLASLSLAAQQTSSQSEDLPTINVKGDKNNTRTEDLNSYTTSAMRTTTGLGLSPRETPQSVSVITQTQLKERGITRMEDALKTTTGINVIPDSGHYRFQSRGFYIDQIEEDGMATAVNGGASGNPYRDPQSLSDLAIYDHIEVVRGATGLTQANGEPGGTINAVRKRPTSEKQMGGDVSIDRFGKMRTTVDLSGALNPEKDLRVRVVGGVERDRSFKDDVKGSERLLYGVVEKDIGANTLLTFGGMVQNHHETPDYFGLPMAQGGRDAGFPKDTYLGLDWNYGNFNKAGGFGEIEHHFNDDWRLTSKISYTRNDSESAFGALADSNTRYEGLPTGGTLPLNNMSRYINSGKQMQFQTNLNGKYYLLGRDHDVFAGYTFANESSDSRWRRIRNNTAFDPFTFRGDEIATPNWGDYNDRTLYGSKRKTHAITLGTRFNPLDNLHLLVGSRYNHWVGRDYTDYDWWNDKPDSDVDTQNKLKRNHFTPYAGITYDLDANQSVYANYSSIFKAQSSTDENGRVLDPVIGNNYEVGWKGEWFDGNLNTSVALFQIEQKNRPISMTNPTTNRSYAIASGKVRSRGLDAEVSGNLSENWKLFAGYTYNTSKYLERESDRYPAGMNFSKHTPKHMLRLYSSYRLPGAAEKWTVGGGVSLQSATSSIWNVEQGGYALWNANAQYKVNDHFNVGVAINNLTNKRYFENHKVRANGINNFLGEPRNAMLNFQWNL
ncbi:MAG: TonB-dependent siderophore receptor [Cardiobacteriaceae bacterium]|nr:TonB-dependent siderophore receptor [Cardiobacteriaceae bacterium]